MKSGSFRLELVHTLSARFCEHRSLLNHFRKFLVRTSIDYLQKVIINSFTIRAFDLALEKLIVRTYQSYLQNVQNYRDLKSDPRAWHPSPLCGEDELCVAEKVSRPPHVWYAWKDHSVLPCVLGAFSDYSADPE